jgi:DNA invertase Pin-like site-specific DNA recombinase
MVIDIIYSRVSKEDETEQDIIQQELKVIEKFNLKDAILLGENEQIYDKISLNKPIILRERGTAYNMDMFHRRHEFHKFLDFACNYDKLTIKDIFFRNYKKVDIRIFAWDSHRYMRNMEYGLQYLLLCDFLGIEIYTYKDNRINEVTATPNEKLVKFIILMIHSFSGEEYSYTTSENVKKSIKHDQGITIGTQKDPNGRKWGRPFIDEEGNRVILKPEEINNLNERILQLDKYYTYQKVEFYYDRILAKILAEFKIKISKSYISGLKKDKL